MVRGAVRRSGRLFVALSSVEYMDRRYKCIEIVRWNIPSYVILQIATLTRNAAIYEKRMKALRGVHVQRFL